MTNIEDIFQSLDPASITKWNNYLAAYDFVCKPFRGQSPVVVEIGVLGGGSLELWRQYFGPGARIIGVDINPDCRALEERGFEIVIADTGTSDGIRLVLEKAGGQPFDIVIDDGGHYVQQQIFAFEQLFGNVRDGGVYIVEDTHTSYWGRFGGRYRRRASFVEFAKRAIDSMHAQHIRSVWYRGEPALNRVRSMHVYNSLIAFVRGSPANRKTSSRGGQRPSDDSRPSDKRARPSKLAKLWHRLADRYLPHV